MGLGQIHLMWTLIIVLKIIIVLKNLSKLKDITINMSHRQDWWPQGINTACWGLA